MRLVIALFALRNVQLIPSENPTLPMNVNWLYMNTNAAHVRRSGVSPKAATPTAARATGRISANATAAKNTNALIAGGIGTPTCCSTSAARSSFPQTRVGGDELGGARRSPNPRALARRIAAAGADPTSISVPSRSTSASRHARSISIWSRSKWFGCFGSFHATPTMWREASSPRIFRYMIPRASDTYDSGRSEYLHEMTKTRQK